MPKTAEERYSIWPDYVKVGALSYPPGSTLGPRVQPTIELVMIQQGDMTVFIDNKPLYFKGNTVTIFFPGHLEYYLFSKDGVTLHSYVHLALPYIPDSLKNHLYQLPRSIPLSKRMAQLTNDSLQIKSSNLSTRETLLKMQAMMMFWLFIGEAELLCKNETKKPSDDLIQRASQYIETHLHEEITLEDIAAAVSVCPEYLIRIFHQQRQITPIAYLWQKRVQLGIDLLEHSGLSISEIAKRCGFKTRNHFSRKITETTGYSPKFVRRKIWQSIEPQE